MLSSHLINSRPIKLRVKDLIHAKIRLLCSEPRKSLSHLAGLFLLGLGSLILTITPDLLAYFPRHGRRGLRSEDHAGESDTANELSILNINDSGLFNPCEFGHCGRVDSLDRTVDSFRVCGHFCRELCRSGSGWNEGVTERA